MHSDFSASSEYVSFVCTHTEHVARADFLAPLISHRARSFDCARLDSTTYTLYVVAYSSNKWVDLCVSVCSCVCACVCVGLWCTTHMECRGNQNIQNNTLS